MKKVQIKNRILRNNRGTTLIEMIVCFMMLAIFLTAAFSIITHITTLYYQVKGETYGKQVSDIILTKIESEIRGAKYSSEATGDKIYINDSATATSGTNMTFYDRTNTKVKLYAENGLFKIRYFGFTNVDDADSRSENIWKFDKKAYNGYEVKNLRFIKASELGKTGNESATALAQDYGINVSAGDYGEDVMLVLLELNSHHYGTYKTYKFVRMYNVEPASGGGSGSNP